MAFHVLEEAERCLQCKNPSCVNGCPVGTSIREMIHMLLDGRIMEAGEMLFMNNPFSLVCSYVCPHELQCEGNCVLGRKGNPVHVSSIEQYISDFYLNNYNPGEMVRNGSKIAVIGAGPGGMTLAMILAKRGYSVTIFESNEKTGGVLRYGIPDFRLPRVILDRLDRKMKEMGVKVRQNSLVGPNISLKDIFRDGYRAVCDATGVWKPNMLGIKGETLSHVHYAIDYLKAPKSYELGRNVIVVGAGNVAMDAARTAMRHGAEEVSICYRKCEASMPARKHEVSYARLDGVRLVEYLQPVEIKDEGVLFVRTRRVSVTEDGVESIELVEGSEELIRADSVIIAASQEPKRNIVSNTSGIKVDARGHVETDSHGRTSQEGIFATGDVVTGAKTVVEAVRFSKVVADAIDEYVRNSGKEQIVEAVMQSEELVGNANDWKQVEKWN